MKNYAARRGGLLATRPQLLDWVFNRLDENKDGVFTLDEYKKLSEIRAGQTAPQPPKTTIP